MNASEGLNTGRQEEQRGARARRAGRAAASPPSPPSPSSVVTYIRCAIAQLKSRLLQGKTQPATPTRESSHGGTLRDDEPAA
jgi:hypothetical protein